MQFNERYQGLKRRGCVLVQLSSIHDCLLQDSNIELNIVCILEPSEVGVIPPEYRSSFHGNNGAHSHASPRSASGGSPRQDKGAHNWANNPVELWAKEQVGLLSSHGNEGMKMYEGMFSLLSRSGSFIIHHTISKLLPLFYLMF